MLSRVGSWREVFKACMEGMIFVLGLEEKRMVGKKKTNEWRNRAMRENRLAWEPETVWRN